MGAFTDLEADATNFGAQQAYLDSIKSDYSAASVPLIFKTEAKDLLKLDLQKALGLLPSNADDMATLDLIVEAQEALLKQVLAYKQMALVFEDKNEAEGSMSYGLWKHYDRAYSNERAGFGGLTRKRGSTTVTSHGIMR